jgi:microcystin-dependent protein
VSDPFVAEIRVFGFSFPPTGWALCNGQLLPLSQNTALFALLGTTYGGDGKSTFALPNLQGSVPVHPRDNSGYFTVLGQQGGTETVTLLESEIPTHTHVLGAIDVTGETPVPTNNTLARYPGAYHTNTSANLQQMHPQSMSVAGSSLPHTNMMPYLTLNFSIALQGIFPPRS